MDTIEYATFRYDTAEVEIGLKHDLLRNLNLKRVHSKLPNLNCSRNLPLVSMAFPVTHCSITALYQVSGPSKWKQSDVILTHKKKQKQVKRTIVLFLIYINDLSSCLTHSKIKNKTPVCWATSGQIYLFASILCVFIMPAYFVGYFNQVGRGPLTILV